MTDTKTIENNTTLTFQDEDAVERYVESMQRRRMRDRVSEMAREALESWMNGDHSNEHDAIHEVVESSEYVIYTSSAWEYVQHSENAGAAIHEFGLADIDDEGTLATRLAYSALSADVAEAFDRLKKRVEKVECSGQHCYNEAMYLDTEQDEPEGWKYGVDDYLYCPECFQNEKTYTCVKCNKTETTYTDDAPEDWEEKEGDDLQCDDCLDDDEGDEQEDQAEDTTNQ